MFLVADEDEVCVLQCFSILWTSESAGYSDLHEKAISRSVYKRACLGTITLPYAAVNSLQFNPSRDFCYMKVG
jgi:hypothetical protein